MKIYIIQYEHVYVQHKSVISLLSTTSTNVKAQRQPAAAAAYDIKQYFL